MGSKTFSLNEYDGIGFDLDCTIAEYNVNELMKLVYNSLIDYLIKKKNYDADDFKLPYEENEYFLQKGLFMDLVKGNILKVNEKGEIIKATHGTVPLSEAEIVEQYGSSTSVLLQEYVSNPLLMFSKSGKILRASLDCFDLPAVLVFATMVDGVDRKRGEPSPEYNVWKDIVAGLYHLYSAENFDSEESEFFTQLRKNPSLYYYKWSTEKVNWLKELKAQKFTFLVTGSFLGFASHTASYCIGENWRDYFNIIVTYARKPYFFIQNNPFIKFGSERGEVVQGGLQVNTVYCQGNWPKLKDLISRHTNIEQPECLYIGDNMLQDVYASSHYRCCSSIAVESELKLEVESQSWGSFFGTKEGGTSFWNHIVKENALCCISSLDVLMSRPLDFRYSCLSKEEASEVDEINGYYAS